MAEYLTGQGEVLDLIVRDHYGRDDLVEAVLDVNPGLAALGPVLPPQTRVVLPGEGALALPPDTPLVRLWGAE